MNKIYIVHCWDGTKEDGKNSMPVSTMVGVNGFVRAGSKIEIEVTAIIEK